MRKLFHLFLIGIVATPLLQVPAIAGTGGSVASPIGVILQAEHAVVGGDWAVNGASIFDGDRLQTNASGSLRVRLGASQVYLLPWSTAVFHQLGHGFKANLTGGTVLISAAKDGTFLLLANGVEIRPGTTQPTVAQVTVVSPNELLLTNRRGVLKVSAKDEVRALPEGSSYRLLFEPPESQGPQGVQPSGQMRRALIWILAAGGIAATGITIWRLAVSEDKL